MKAEAEQEHHKLQLDGLEREKAGLHKALSERKNEIDEIQARLETSSNKVLALTKANGELDSRLQAALAEKSRATLSHSKLEQEKEILEKSNAWLVEELDKRAEAGKREREKSTLTIVELESKHFEVQSKLEQLASDYERVSTQLRERNEMLRETSENLKETKENLALKEESFEKELALAQRMAQLYKESAEEHTKRSNSLQGVVDELKIEIDKTSESHRKAIEELEGALRASEQRLVEEKELRERVVATAATASLTINPTKSIGTAPDSSSQLTPTEIYGKFIETEEMLRTEKLKNKEREIYMEDLLLQVEKRAALVKEQQLEYDNMKESHARLLHDIEELSVEKKRALQSLRKAETDLKISERERRSLEQQVKDLGQQVTRLLYESSNASEYQKTGKSAAEFNGGNATDVTTQLLVEFSSIQELQEQNQKLLKINRELSEAAEATKIEAQQELRDEYEEKMESLRGDLQGLKKSREAAEVMMNQVVRQRDTLRQLLQNAGGDLGAGREMYARSIGKDSAMTEVSMNDADTILESDSSHYKHMFEELEEQFNEFKKKSENNYSSLEKEVSVLILVYFCRCSWPYGFTISFACSMFKPRMRFFQPRGKPLTHMQRLNSKKIDPRGSQTPLIRSRNTSKA